MARAIAHTYTKLGDRRGTRRLWLEGRKLERSGIEPGQRFSVTWDKEMHLVVLRFDEEGDRKVSRRLRNGREMPIIDINASEIEEALGEGIARAKVTICPGRIEVQVHPDDLAAQERLDRLVSKIASGEPLVTGSLAHGGGVIDHAIHTGLKDAGVHARLAFAVEIEDAVLDAAATNNPIWDQDTLLISGGMEEVEPKLLPKVDILVAGLPCTGASKAGKAKNHNATTEEHPRAGALFISFLNIVKHVQPSVVVLENVTDYAHSVSAKLIKVSLETWGYDVRQAVLSGRDFGSIENRRRLCMIAISPEIELTLDRLAPEHVSRLTLGDVMEEVGPESDAWLSTRGMLAKAARDRAKGANFKPNIVGPEVDQIGALGAGYSKVRQTEAKIRHPSDPDLVRLLTPSEHAAVKTIPPELVAGLSNKMAHTILGNSVIWEAWRAVGRHVAECGKAYANKVAPPLDLKAVPMPELATKVVELFGASDLDDEQGMAMRR